MNKRWLLLAGMAVTGAGMSGCTLAPKYDRPQAPVPTTWPTGSAYRPMPATTQAAPAAEIPWQDFFLDARLRKVIATALENNRDLRIASLNVERARAMYGIQRAELLPAVNAVGTATRRRVPADLSNSDKATTVKQYSVDLGVAAWELDFFGRIRSLAQGALEEYLGTQQAQRSAQILLVSGVADAYLTLAADRENLKLAQTTLDAQQSALDLVNHRFDRGLAPELDVHRAQAQVESARLATARFTQLVAQDQNALNLLAGAPVSGDLLPAGLADVAAVRELSPGMSSEVLLGRPDVLQAESQLRAAYANIGAARAAFFPRISLTASAGTASSELSGLFKSGSGTWGFTPQVIVPIFDARIWAAARVTEADQKIALTQYERAIQTSFREVADALAVRGTVDQQVSSQEAFVHAVSETYRLSNIRYTRGIDSYLSVLDAQRSLYAAQQDLVNLRLAKITNQVRLYAVLGGGWETARANGPSSPSTHPAADSATGPATSDGATATPTRPPSAGSTARRW